eukprot:GDKJ01009473.1.p1 GENE.GDKJ01009473.1~~GDKJ01009473.1.p1  ORF type:complete len:220 (+),score=33.19 GDKJ01009473.1:37-660(+)
MSKPKWNAELGVWEGNLAPGCDDDILNPLIVFGYGSLCWRPDFAHDLQIPGYIRGFKRRFWQASMDHRGTPEFPGRVLTLIESDCSADRVYGIGFRVPADKAVEVLKELDFREKGGYIRRKIQFTCMDEKQHFEAIVYVGTEDNPNFSPTSEDQNGFAETASIISKAHGPSGRNIDYFLKLRDFFLEREIRDPYLDSLHETLTTISS